MRLSGTMFSDVSTDANDLNSTMTRASGSGVRCFCGLDLGALEHALR